MIQVSMQVTCDGCGNDVCGQDEPMDGVGISKKSVREDFAKSGWRHYGAKDYCPKCVKSVKYAAKSSVFENRDANARDLEFGKHALIESVKPFLPKTDEPVHVHKTATNEIVDTNQDQSGEDLAVPPLFNNWVYHEEPNVLDHRRNQLIALLNGSIFKGDRRLFCKKAGITRRILEHLLSADSRIGFLSGYNLAKRVGVDFGYFELTLCKTIDPV